jgi:hypothetical protein
LIGTLGFTTCAVWHMPSVLHGSEGTSRGRIKAL